MILNNKIQAYSLILVSQICVLLFLHLYKINS